MTRQPRMQCFALTNADLRSLGSPPSRSFSHSPPASPRREPQLSEVALIDWNGPSLASFYRSIFDLKHSQAALANGAWGGRQTALKTNGGDRVYAFTRTRDANVVLV